MNRRLLFQPLFVITLAACATAEANATRLSIPHPDNSSKKVEYFIQRPEGSGFWPAVIFLHGHQDYPPPGGKDFVTWGVLERFAKRGYLEELRARSVLQISRSRCATA